MRFLMLSLLMLSISCSEAKTLLVGLEEANNLPFEYVDNAGHLTGFHVELVKSVASRLEWEVEFRRMSWPLVIKMLESGELDAATYVARSPERETFALFLPDNILHVSHSTIFIKAERVNEIHYEPPLEDFVSRWRVAIPAGYYMNDKTSELLQKGMPLEERTVTLAQLFVMLLGGRYDAIFGGTNALKRNRIGIPDIEEKVIPLEGAIFPSKQMYIAFSLRVKSPLAEEFAREYREYRQLPEYRELAEKFEMLEWLPTESEFQ
ncbi:amino acid ABC transporter substrate-binding protein [Hahella sp. CCB-MM4]|uniref:substrate-binding periplasmic protein n=1 Tax=Hahella sp. (strain CCB-MM4) TaxID=1926491 RepID=UPI000B9B6B24|nr:transporter substrate-binding domain-containing protein [Hahella sp. CCB-MM4]OZG74195.1 amino acid ABC transporter substrate-binding protein [Hahella sp. CCB-MM4]